MYFLDIDIVLENSVTESILFPDYFKLILWTSFHTLKLVWGHCTYKYAGWPLSCIILSQMKGGESVDLFALCFLDWEAMLLVPSGQFLITANNGRQYQS